MNTDIPVPMHTPSRRDFLKNCASGLVVWFVLGPKLDAQKTEANYPITIKVRPKDAADFNAYLRIGEDGQPDQAVGQVAQDGRTEGGIGAADESVVRATGQGR